MINLGDIHDCSITAKPALSNTEELILPDDIGQDKKITKNGAIISGMLIQSFHSLIDLFFELLRCGFNRFLSIHSSTNCICIEITSYLR